jgi:hypothetical protein
MVETRAGGEVTTEGHKDNEMLSSNFEKEKKETAEPVCKGYQTRWARWFQERIHGLPIRKEMRAGSKLAIGTRVLVLKGDAGKDLGQMAIVSRHVRTQMEITYRDAAGEIKTRRKQPASLIALEEGVEMVVDENGWPTICRVRSASDKTENEWNQVSDAEE